MVSTFHSFKNNHEISTNPNNLNNSFGNVSFPFKNALPWLLV